MKKVIFLFAILILNYELISQTTYYWRSESTSGNWNDADHWWDGYSTSLPSGSEILSFGNNSQTSMTNDLTSTNRYRIIFESGANINRIISGTTENTFYDYSSNKPQIQNNSTANHEIGFPIKLGYNPLEINPINGDLTISGNINTNGNYIDIYGSGNTITFSSVISGTGGITLKQTNTLILTGTNTYSGATTIEAGTLKLEGSIANSDVTVKSGAFLIINGNSTEVNNLTIESGGSVTINVNKALTVNGTLTNNAGTSGLVIESDATGNGSLIISSGTTEGSVERYVPAYTTASDGWHEISCPIDGLAISSTNVEPTLYDDDLYRWDESNNVWENYYPSGGGTPQFTTLDIGRGYLVAYKNNKTIRFEGSLNNSSVTFTDMSYNAGNGDGWHLLGNPFPSAITYDNPSGDWNLNNVSGTAKVYDESTGNYATINAGDPIPSTNGFFVQVTSATNSITIPTTAKTHSSTGNYKSGKTDKNKLTLKVTNDANNFSDINVVGFKAEATNDWDIAFDSHKLMGAETAPQLWTAWEGQMFSDNYLPFGAEQKDVPLHFKAGVNTTYHIAVEGIDGFSENVEIYLEDLFTGNTIDLKKQQLYSFEATKSDDPNRFVLHFYNVTSTPEFDKPEKDALIYAYGKHIVVKSNGTALNGQVEFVNLLGQTVYTCNVNGNNFVSVAPQLEKGVYIVRYKQNNGQVQSNKVVLQ